MFSDGLFACPVGVLPALPQVLCCKKRVGTDRAHVCHFRTGSAGHIRFVCGWACRVGRRSRKGFVRNRLPPERLPLGPPVRKIGFPAKPDGFSDGLGVSVGCPYQFVQHAGGVVQPCADAVPRAGIEEDGLGGIPAEYGVFCSSARVADASACGLRTAM